ncbi:MULTISPECIES: sulfatase family protein [unclassified Saccharicrinis]|uniref:sulfatase family protein n=1 Tax=unclassified Saccharicrinis TaxID=2646859 RepID=UPI003D3346ED
MKKYFVAFKIRSLSFLLLVLISCTNTPVKQKPNLLFVFSDQQAFDMVGCYGNKQIITPNIDKLATEGLRFTNCFSNSPICTPYRGMLMSGQYSLYNGCFTNDRPLLPGNGKKFAEVLRDDGYYTGYVGKWHLLGGDRNRPIPEGPMRYGFDDVFYSNNCHVDFRPGKCFFWNENDKKEYFNEWEVYGQTNQAIDFLESVKDSESPFALFVSWHPPHDWGKFKGEDGKMHYRYDAPQELMSYYNRDSIKVRPGIESTPDLRHMYHGHMAMTTGVDIAFGNLMNKLKEIGADENTIVIFTSDHGDMLEYQNAIYPKQYPHDYSLQVPFIISYPHKIIKETTTSLLFSALDIMPTILGLMEQEVPKECQGKNLSEAILSGNEDAVDFLPIWLHNENGYRGVITKEYTYARSKAGDSKLHNVLFDRVNDPYQLSNNFDDSSTNVIKNELWGITQGWMESIGDEFYQKSQIDSLVALTDSASYQQKRPVGLFN